MSISASQLYELIKKQKKFILIFTFSLTTISVVVSLMLTKYYTSNISLYQSSEKKKVGGGGLKDISNIASSFGIDFGGGQFAYHIPDIIKSRRLQSEILQKKWNSKFYNDSLSLIDYWEKLDEEKIISIKKISKIFTSEIINNDLKSIEDGLEELSSRVSVKEDQSGLFIATVTMEEPKLSTEIANHIAEFIQNYVSEETKHKATQYREFIEERMSIAKIDLTFSEDNLTIFRKNHPLQLDTPELTAERARFMRTIEVNQQVYVTLRQQFEIARLEELRDKPVIEILDKAIEPVKKSSPKRVLIVCGTFVLSYLMAIYFASIMQRRKEI